MIKKANKEMAEYLVPSVKKLWPEHDLNSLERILKSYIESNDSAVFVDVDNEIKGLALCALHTDYVE